jgi:Zn-dependent M28 family amino/carboxypeptidase
LVEETDIPWELRVRAARQLGINEARQSDARQTIPIMYLERSAAERLIGAAHMGDIIGSSTLSVRQTFRDVRTANVYARWPGTESARSEHVVVLAHLDHVGIGAPVNGDSIYNGAVDNASGVAALLAMGKAFAEMPNHARRSVIFLATTAEEQGEIGSEYFVRNPPVPVTSIVAAINIDGTAITPFTGLNVGGGANSTLGSIAGEAAEQMGLSVVQEPLGVGGSDHSPFLLAGIPPLWVEAALPDDWMRTRYHTPQDDLRQPLDFAAAARYSQFVFLTIYRIADAVQRPAWNTGEFFGERGSDQ